MQALEKMSDRNFGFPSLLQSCGTSVSASAPTNYLLAMPLDSVSAYVDSLCSAYYDGAELIQHIKSNDKSLETFADARIATSAQELGLSLNRGESAVRDHYERIHKRCGEAFAQGDKLARDALQDQISHLQGQVIAKLKSRWKQDTSVDFITLQDICDSIQDRAILVLMQLQQRTIALGQVDTLPFDRFSTDEWLSSLPKNATLLSRHNVSAGTLSPSSSISSVNSNCPHARKLSSTPSCRTNTSPMTTDIGQWSRHPDPPQGSRESTSTNGRDAAQYKPMAAAVTTTRLFGIGKRTKVEPIVNPPENPLVDKYLAAAIEDAKYALSSNPSTRSKTNPRTTSTSSIQGPGHPTFNAGQDQQSLRPNPLERPIEPSISSDTGTIKFHESQHCHTAASVETLTTNGSINSINLEDMLPNENNKYAGFCKGAWRQQIGDRKRAIEERVRPGGMFNAAKYYQCKQCKFEGRFIPMDKKKGGFDTRVFKLVQGIQFRWEFMFKSHVQVREPCLDPTKATFGCIFCCVEGRSTPVFTGIQTFMNHLVLHRDHLPSGKVLYRMNCLIGRQATIEEDFDINIISIEGGKI